MCQCTKLEVDLDDDTIFLMAKTTSLLKIKHPCSRSFIDDVLAKISAAENGEVNNLSQVDMESIHKAVGEAVFNDLITDSLIMAINEAKS